MRIANNISAMNTNRALGIADNALTKSMERLSSGYRINRAADDAAGLAISEKMRAQISGLRQASTNAQDGISMIQTAEGGLNESHSILQRMRELAVQASNSATLTAADQNEIQKEIDQLVEELDRISTDTEFNTKKLLNGESAVKSSAQNGAATVGTAGNVKVGIDELADGDAMDLTDLVKLSTNNKTEAGVYAVEITKTAEAATIEGADAAAITTAGTLVINGESVEIGATDSIDTIITKINNITGKSGVVASEGATTGALKLDTNKTGSAVTISIQGSNALLNELGLIGDTDTTSTALTDAGMDAEGTINGISAVGKGNVLTSADTAGAAGISVEIDDSLYVAAGAADVVSFDMAVNTDGELTLQIGANAGQNISFSINDMGAEALGVTGLDVITDPEAALTAIDKAIDAVSAERSNMGAIQNRLEHTIANLGVSAENLSSAESRIRDVDMADEVTKLTTQQILIQASTSMLAQANQKTQNVLSLLG